MRNTEREHPPVVQAEHDAQIEALRQQNAKLQAQLVAMQQLALGPRAPVNLMRRRWVGRSIQLLLVLVGIAIGATYVTYSNADVAGDLRSGIRDGWREHARP